MPKMKNNIWNKVYRFFTSFLPIDNKRKGKCDNCGACCRLPTKCCFLKFDLDNKSYCSIYKYRPLQCRKYPRNKKEWITQDTCSHSFD